MRVLAVALLAIPVFTYPLRAQDNQNPPTVTEAQRRATSDEKAAEVRKVIAEARKRQEAVDRHNTNLWARWTHAVCIGCDPTPKGLRIVHTYPYRVLQGIPAGEDDLRERRGIRI